jgi:hypothetical protein
LCFFVTLWQNRIATKARRHKGSLRSIFSNDIVIYSNPMPIKDFKHIIE